MRDANLAAFRAYNFGETAELFAVTTRWSRRPPGTYRNVNGTQALAYGLIAASVQSGLPLFLASYPITPASELLHALATAASASTRSRPRMRSPPPTWRSAPPSPAASA